MFGGMDVMPFEDFDVLGARVREMVQGHALPPQVRRVEVEFDELPDGDPLVSINVFVEDDQAASREHQAWWTEVVLTLLQDTRRLVPGRTPHVGIYVDSSGNLPT